MGRRWTKRRSNLVNKIRGKLWQEQVEELDYNDYFPQM